MHKPIRILYTNVDCITNKMNEIRVLLKMGYFDYDVLIFTETNCKNIANEYDEVEFQLSGFKLYTKNFMVKGFRGIFCYVRSEFHFIEMDLANGFNEYLCLRSWGMLADILILIIYRSPNSIGVNNCNLMSLLNAFYLMTGAKIVLGDFNLPGIDWANISTVSGVKSLENKFINFVNDHFLFQIVKEATRYRGSQRQNLLDLILVESEDWIGDLKYHPPIGKSDHCVIDFKLRCYSSECIAPVGSNKKNFNLGNYEQMNNYVNENLKFCNRSDAMMLGLRDEIYINALWNKFSQVMNDAINLFVPICEELNCNKYKLRLPRELIELIKLKNKLWKKYIRSKDYSFFLTLKI